MCTACCMRHQAAGHDGVGGSGPHQAAALRCALNHSGCPDLRLDRISITRVALSLPKLVMLDHLNQRQALAAPMR
jgi:hypothetical protein